MDCVTSSHKLDNLKPQDASPHAASRMAVTELWVFVEQENIGLQFTFARLPHLDSDILGACLSCCAEFCPLWQNNVDAAQLSCGFISVICIVCTYSVLSHET